MALGAACHGKTDPIKVREAVLLTPLCWETALLGDVKNRLNMWRQILPRLRLAREDDVCRGYRAGTRLIYGLIFLNSLFVSNTLISFHFDQLIVIDVSFMTHCTDTKALLFSQLYLKVKFQGLTGEVQFNLVTGERRVHSGLDILNVLEHNVEKVCTRW